MATTTPNYDINYDDERFTNVETQKQEALTEVTDTYSDMINQSDSFYQAQINASKDWANQQQQLQQEQTDFTIEQINQQKTQAGKDYTKEQAGAYVDWQKQSNQYGANAEQMAANGLSNTGFSESSQVSMYNTYQNRVATARENYSKAVLNYDNAIKDAQLQNNSKLAEIAFTALQQQLELSLQGFQYKNSLITEQLAQKQAVDDRYYNRYQDVLNQMNTENSMSEQIRQFNENLTLEREKFDEQKNQFKLQFDEQIRQFDLEYDQRKKEFDEQIRQFDLEIERLKEQDKKENEYKIKQLELQKSQLRQEQTQWKNEYNLKKAQLREEQRQFDKKYGEGGIDKTSFNAINTPYYQGSLNSDAEEYGTFSNGYQPKGISGYGNVKDSGDTITFETQTLSGQKQTVTQTIWKTPDGTKWYWEGRENKYLKVPKHGGGGRSR